MIGELYDTTWGPIRMWCSSISFTGGRSQIVHELATGDDHPVEDRGRAPRRFRCELLFDDMPGESTSAIDRLRTFELAVERGAEELFQHPVGARAFVKVSTWEYEIDEDSNVASATVEFLASQPIEAVHPAGIGTSPISGVDMVAARADELDAALESVDIDSTVPTEMVAAQASWVDTDTVPTRDILVQLASFSDQLATLVSQLEDDIAYFEAYRAAIMLGEAFRNAALAATSETSSIFVLKIATPISLLALVTRIYGGAESEDRERQVRSLNDVRTPGGLLEAGAELVMPSRSTGARV